MTQYIKPEKESQKPIAAISPPDKSKKECQDGKWDEILTLQSKWVEILTNNGPEIVSPLYARAFYENLVMNAGERLDILNDVYYNEEVWQGEQELYKGLSEEERKRRRYEIGRQGKQIAFLDIREQVLKKGYTIRFEEEGFLLLEKEENKEFHRIEMNNLAAVREVQQNYDIRITYRNQSKEEVWYLKVKTAATTDLINKKLCFSSAQLFFAQKAEGYYHIAIVMFDPERKDLNFCFFYNPPTLFWLQEFGFEKSLQISKSKYSTSMQVKIDNLICDEVLYKLDMYHFFCYKGSKNVVNLLCRRKRNVI